MTFKENSLAYKAMLEEKIAEIESEQVRIDARERDLQYRLDMINKELESEEK